jgi:heme/copper-type cytochrome/quinol oxidase subunit 3
LLLLSGISVTWAHAGVNCNSMINVIDGMLITIFLGFFFVVLQGFEYYETSFHFFDSVYACSFFMLTGLHGFHVIVGAFFLLVCFFRFLCGHFSIVHHLGFLMSI